MFRFVVPCSDPGTRQLLAALSHSRAKTMAPCLTPGCAKYDCHIGPCTKDEMVEQGCKRSRSTVPRYEAGAAPPPSLLHAVVAAQGILPSDVSIYSPRTEAPRKSEPRASGSQLSRKLQYPSKEDDGENENDDDDAEEEEEEEEVAEVKPNVVSKAVLEAEVVKARVVSKVVAELVTETEVTAVVPMAMAEVVTVAVAVAVAAVAEAEA